MGYFKNSDSKDTFASTTITWPNPNLFAGIVPATCFDNYLALGLQVGKYSIISKADDENLSKHEVHDGERASNKSEPTVQQPIGRASHTMCFSRRFPQTAQNTSDEAGRRLLTRE